jgi:hypothetical protein
MTRRKPRELNTLGLIVLAVLLMPAAYTLLQFLILLAAALAPAVGR